MFSAAKSMAGAMCIKVTGSSQKVCCPIHPGKQAAAAASSSKQQASSKQAASKPASSSRNRNRNRNRNSNSNRVPVVTKTIMAVLAFSQLSELVA